MNTQFIYARLTDTKNAGKSRRFRNVLANSGKIMESNEVRPIDQFYVMGRDGKLYRIADLNKDPEKQAEKYKLTFAQNHGHFDPVTGQFVLGVEDIIGDARVWLDDDGLHARVYFANDDAKADHAWAVSDNASYSVGADYYEDGYSGAGNEIDEPIVILREISMVDTGNDPRAMTLDTLKGKGASGAANGDNKKDKKGFSMKKRIDELTPDERDAMSRELMGVLDKFTTNAPESETEPTAREGKDSVETADDGAKEPTVARAAEVGGTADNNDTKSTKDTLHMPVITVKDRGVKQERTVDSKDWRFSAEARRKFADMAYAHKGFRDGFSSEWHSYLKSKGASHNDGITGLGLPVDTRSLFIDALEKSDGLISHFDELGGKSYLIRLLAAEEGNDAESARAGGFTKGDTKIFQQLLATPRTIYNRMVYKMLDLDALELYENPDLVEVRARELVQALMVEVERASTIGDGRTAPSEGQADRRMFAGGRGFYSMLADAQATGGFGQLMATSITMPAGSNLYDASIEADSEIEAEGGLIYVTKKSVVKALRLAKKSSTSNEPLIEPGTRIEDLLGAERVYTPAWMANAPVDVIVFANKSYGLIGEKTPDLHPEFKTEKNQNVLLAEFPRGGSLKAYKAAVAITFATASGASTRSTSAKSSAKGSSDETPKE